MSLAALDLQYAESYFAKPRPSLRLIAGQDVAAPIRVRDNRATKYPANDNFTLAVNLTDESRERIVRATVGHGIVVTLDTRLTDGEKVLYSLGEVRDVLSTLPPEQVQAASLALQTMLGGPFGAAKGYLVSTAAGWAFGDAVETVTAGTTQAIHNALTGKKWDEEYSWTGPATSQNGARLAAELLVGGVAASAGAGAGVKAKGAGKGQASTSLQVNEPTFNPNGSVGVVTGRDMRGAISANAQTALRAKLSGLQKAQATAVLTKTLPDGRMRYYTKEVPARALGKTRGASFVTEYDPKTGNIRQWMESYDHSGSIIRVHPKSINGQPVKAQHYPPTGNELEAWK